MGRIRSFLRGCNKKRPAVRSFLYGKMKMEGNSCHLRGKEGVRQRIFASCSPCTTPEAPPLVADATTFAPVGSMSLDFRVAALPYKSSSFATPRKRGHDGCWRFQAICMWRSSGRKTIQPGFARGKCTPFGAGAPLPPKGEVLAVLCIVVLMGKSLFCGFILPPE